MRTPLGRTAEASGNPPSPACRSLLFAPMREVQSAKADFVPFQRRVSNPSPHRYSPLGWSMKVHSIPNRSSRCRASARTPHVSVA